MKENQIEHTTDSELETTTHAEESHTEVHHGPHIPAIQWEKISDNTFISNTNVTTFIFLIFVIIFSFFWNSALKSKKRTRLKLMLITYMEAAYNYLTDAFGNKEDAKNFFPMVIGIFTIILFGNVFWIVIDWLASSISEDLFIYIRPMNSDLNTTLSLALLTVISTLVISSKTHWIFKTAKSYLFHFSWKNLMEKFVNVFVWWLHTLWLVSTMLSLSLRLFGNIFAWAILLWVVLYLLSMATESMFQIWRLVSLPFWFFELFVSLVQAAVFAWLMIAYFKGAKEEH